MTLSYFLPTLPPFSITGYKHHLDELNSTINHQISLLGLQGAKSIDHFIQLRTQAIDNILTQIFGQVLSDELALFAIGGYGCGELFPYSDVDILVLGNEVQKHQTAIERFVATLWDIGITPAICVHDTQTLTAGMSEPSFATAVLDVRFITGNAKLTDAPINTLSKIWTIRQFYDVKLQEAKTRHLSHHGTEYHLEPNVKNGVGGLRDLHILLWLGKFYFGDIKDFKELAGKGFLLTKQCVALQNAQTFLWHIRHHLHTLAERGEERLLFDYQKTIARNLGYHGTGNESAEALMRVYYQHAMCVASLSELLCEYFYESYLDPVQKHTALDDDFYRIDEYQDKPDNNPNNDNTSTAKIAISDPQLFVKKPKALLGIFLAMATHNIKKISASTLNAICLAIPLIDETYRQNPAHKALFLANLQDNNYLFHRLRLMKRYGVLGAYLPAFEHIMGLSQYDLFHRYTVDAHTLYLIRILHRFGDLDNDEYQQKFDLVSQIYQHINRKDILAIASLFHDIAKGRDGDHSTLGAIDAYEFCISHNMSVEDANFVAWLVQEHLTMSLTAQKKDIYDPDVIGEFARLVGNITRLNHLYVLTVADMNATNSQLWNSWRASLLKQLYLSTHKVLSLGVQSANKDNIIHLRQERAKVLMPHIDQDTLNQLWQNFDEDYFLKQKPEDIAWQSGEILTHRHTLTQQPIITLQNHADLALDAISLFICIQDQDNLFAKTVCVLDQMGLSVLDATILNAQIDGADFALDSYILIDRFAKRDSRGSLKSDFLLDQTRQQALIGKLKNAFYHNGCLKPAKSFYFDRQLKHFNVPTQVQFEPATSHAHQGHHVMHLITKDRPSLLAHIGQIFSRQHIKVHGAKITTMGERAEDVFYISAKDGASLPDDQLNNLKRTLIEVLH